MNYNKIMKTLTDHFNENLINEARQLSYSVAFVDCPNFSVEILVDKEDQKEFEKFLEKEEGNTFMHADGGNVEY